MNKEIVAIPKDEYELLVKCRHIVESDFEESFSENFIKAVKESEEDYKKKRFVRIKNLQDRKKLFDSM